MAPDSIEPGPLISSEAVLFRGSSEKEETKMRRKKAQPLKGNKGEIR
jgi:hypothetical protein